MGDYGSGSLFQRRSGPRAGHWVKRYKIDGRTVSASWPHKPTRAQLAAKRRELSQSSRLLPETESETVAAYLERWLRDGLPDAKPRTVRGYHIIVDRHIVPRLGAELLSELSPPDVQRFVNGLQTSPRTALHILACLRSALSQAVRWGVLRSNPCDHIKGPRVAHSEHHILSPEQTRNLLVQVRDDPLEALYVLAAMTGMRQGEILGLRWQAVNLTAGTLSVETSLWWRPVEHRDDGRAGLVRGRGDNGDHAHHLRVSTRPSSPYRREPVLVEPKTERSRRTIHLPDRVLAALTKHRKREMQQRKEVDAGLVFTQRHGTALEPSSVYRALKRHLKAAKLPDVRFHDLRHSAASMLLADGMPVGQVSELLGHANPTVTWNIYGHQLEKARKETAERISALIGEEESA